MMDFLRSNNIVITKHDWQEEDWDVTVIGFLTNVYLSSMSSEHATKLASQMFKNNARPHKMPIYRIKPIMVRIKKDLSFMTTSAFGIEVRRTDASKMGLVCKESLKTESFIPFQMKRINEIAYNKAVEYVASKGLNTWTIVVNYVTDGGFFKLEDKIKALPFAEHIIHDAVSRKVRVLVSKSSFHQLRGELKIKLANWVSDLDPEDVRLYGCDWEIAHIMKDDFSSDAGSYFTNSVASIMSWAVEEIDIPPRNIKQPSQGTVTTNTPSELSVPPAISVISKEDSEVNVLKAQVAKYQSEFTMFSQKIEAMNVILEMIVRQFKPEEREKELKSDPSTTGRRQHVTSQDDEL